MKKDESDFYLFIKLNNSRIPCEHWEQLTKRQYFILEKWRDKKIWNYGVSIRSGWLEPDSDKRIAEIYPKFTLKEVQEMEGTVADA